MKRLMMLGALLILLAVALGVRSGVVADTPGTPESSATAVSADDLGALWDTVNALETRVADLEAEVADLQARLGDESGTETSLSGPTHTVELTLSIIGYDHILGAGSTCSGRAGYDDLQLGAAVTVFDQDGRVIANGSITSAKPTTETCDLSATIENVPEVDFYLFQVSHRDGPTFSLAEMKAADWRVMLSI
jgi:hypothetical protein